MDNQGWIKLHRKILDWSFYQDKNTFRLFMHLLLKANYEPKIWRGVEIQPGQVVTGRKNLNIETQLTNSQIRTALEKLKAANQITIQTFRDYSLITILNWMDYQSDRQPNRTDFAPKIATTKEEDKNKEKKDTPIIPKTDLPPPEQKNILAGLPLPEIEKPEPNEYDLKFAEFVEHRKQIKSPMSDLAKKRMKTRLETYANEGYDILELMDTAIIRGWKDVYLPKD